LKVELGFASFLRTAGLGFTNFLRAVAKSDDDRSRPGEM
jgi:hypothetical protein